MIAASLWLVRLAGLAANLLALLGAHALAAGPLRQPRGTARWLATAVVFGTACTLGLELLGAVGAIGTFPILIAATAFAAAGWASRRFYGETADSAAAAEPAPAGWDATIALAAVLVAAIIFAVPSLFSAVKVVSDGPIYHLYFAARWWKAGRILLVAAPFGENAATYFPANGDLWFTWLLASWGDETLAKVGQAPFLLVAAAAAHGAARLLGSGRSAATIATCWFITSTPLFIFSFEPNVDTIFIAGYLLAVYFFLRHALHGGGVPSLILGALAAGLALGTKAIGVVFLPPLLALAAIGLAREAIPWTRRLGRVGIVLLVPLATGGYWFARNLCLTGNPLYPLDLTVMGHTILAGWYGPEAMRTSPYFIPVGYWRALVDILMGLLDPRMAPVWCVAIVAAWLPGDAGRSRGRTGIRWIGVLAIVNIALYWLVIPYRTQQRFALHAIGLAVVPLAAFLDRSRWLCRAAAALLLLHVFTPQCWPFAAHGASIPWDLAPEVPNAVGSLVTVVPEVEAGHDPVIAGLAPYRAGLCIIAVVTVAAWRELARPWRRPLEIGWGAAAIVLSVAFLGLGYRSADPRYLDPRFRFYPRFDYYLGWRAFDERARGVRVAYAGTDLPYYFLGPGLRNTVRYVNIDRHRDWLLHDYHREARARGEGHWPDSRPGWDRARTDEQAWLDNLDAEGIQLLVVTRVNPAEGRHNVADAEGFPIERVWADAHPERFALLYGRDERDPQFRLYRVIRRMPGPKNGR